MELGLLFLGFLAYLYLPHIVFKLVAERYIDLGRRFDSTEIEEVVGAAIPSLLLNIETCIAIRSSGLLGPTFWFPSVDWAKVANIFFKDDGAERLAHLMESGGMVYPARYLAILFVVVIINGLAYGKGALMGTYLESNNDSIIAMHLPKNVWNWFKFWVSVVFYFLWKVIYSEYHVALFPFTVLRPYVYVRTIDGLIFYGKFVDYEKTKDGAIESIRLEEVRRFSRRYSELLAEGKDPIHRLDGELHIKWERIADFNTASPGHLEKLQQERAATPATALTSKPPIVG